MATLRSSRIEEAQRAADSISRLLETAGKSEQIRQNRQALDRVSSAWIDLDRQVEDGAIITQSDRRAAALQAAGQPATFDEGIGGIFQKFSSGVRPEAGRGGVTQELNDLLLKGQLSTVFGSPTSKTSAQANRDVSAFNRDSRIIQNKKSTSGQKKAAIGRQRTNPNLQIQQGQDYSDFFKGKPKVTVSTKGINDKAFGKEAYDKMLVEAKEDGLINGFSEKSVEQDFNNWWDGIAAEEDPKGFGKLVQDRSEFQGKAKTATSKVPGAPQIPEIPGQAELTEEMAGRILREAGGNKDKARQIAKQKGFKL